MQKEVSCTYVAQNVNRKEIVGKNVVAKTNIFCSCPVIVKVQDEELICNVIG